MKRELQYQVGDGTVTVFVESDGDRYRIRVDDREYLVRVKPGDRGRIDMGVDDQRLRAYVARKQERTTDHTYVGLDGQTWTLTKPDARRTRRGGSAGGGSGALTATMPGLVLDVLVAPGDAVSRGDTLVLMEAMKMELRITAPADGVISAVGCEAGQVVERGRVLVEIED
jgi:biotin carboxyl carrier protein